MASLSHLHPATPNSPQAENSIAGAASPPVTEAAVLPERSSGSVDQQLVEQIVLKWNEASLFSSLGTTPTAPSEKYLSAMHSLIKRIAQLQSAHEQPQGPLNDPEILLPLVLPQAQAVLEQLPTLEQPPASSNLETASETQVDSSSAPNRFAPTPTVPNAWKLHPVQSIQTLAPWLLGQITQSTHETMRLLEGIPAEVSIDRQTSYSGIVRLVACLDVQTAPLSFSIDLVTYQTIPPCLADECFIQLQPSLLGEQITPVKALLQQLVPQLLATAPSLRPFLAGFPIDLLMPHQDWQGGKLRLRLELTFVSREALNLSNPAAHEAEPLPTIKFTQPDWLEQHITTVVEDQLTQVLLQQQIGIEKQPAAETEPLIAIVRQSCVVIDELQRSLSLASRTVAQQVLPLDELALRLLWGMNRSGSEVMRWLSGTQVRLLQPQLNWTTGTLRFGIYLLIRTPEQTWRFDLVQRCLASTISFLAENAIVQYGGQEYQQFSALNDLATVIWQQVSQTTPEILLLRSETEASVTVADLPRQLGVVQLETGFEFLASENFRNA